MKRVMDGFNEAKEKQWIRAKGVSCHSLPALRTAAASDWTEIHLVRVNPQGAHMDTPAETWNAKSDETHVGAVMKEIKTMHAKGHGVIGMKLVGDGDFKNPEDREKAIRFAMAQPEIDSVVIGFKSRTRSTKRFSGSTALWRKDRPQAWAWPRQETLPQTESEIGCTHVPSSLLVCRWGLLDRCSRCMPSPGFPRQLGSSGCSPRHDRAWSDLHQPAGASCALVDPRAEN